MHTHTIFSQDVRKPLHACMEEINYFIIAVTVALNSCSYTALIELITIMAI